MDELMEILEETRPDVDFTAQKALIDDHILGSFDIISMIGEINTAFDVEINAADILPENFNSAESIYRLIQKLQEE